MEGLDYNLPFRWCVAFGGAAVSKSAGEEARLCFLGYLLMEHRSRPGGRGASNAGQLLGRTRNGQVAGRGRAGPGTGSRTGPRPCRRHEGIDAGLRQLNATPHVAQNTSGRRSRIDRRTVRHPGYLASQRARKRIEEAFAWVKIIAGQAKTRFRGTARVGWAFTLAAAA
jgi:hypothetical protein